MTFQSEALGSAISVPILYTRILYKRERDLLPRDTDTFDRANTAETMELDEMLAEAIHRRGPNRHVLDAQIAHATSRLTRLLALHL